MLCKKCGANIEDNSKFCGYCGEAVVSVNPLNQNFQTANNKTEESLNNQQTQKEEILNVFSSVNNNIQNTTLEQPTILDEMQKNDVNLEPVNNEVKIEQPNTTIKENLNVVQPNLEIPSENINTPSESTILPINENTGFTSTTASNEAPSVSTNTQPVTNKDNINKTHNKNNKIIFIIIGVVVGILAILLCFSFVGVSKNSISVLNQAFNNLQLNTKNSFTINANLITVDNENKELSFDALIKSQKKSEDKTNMQIIVNKTELFDEINSYLVIDDKKTEMYLQSTLVDLLGLTSSLEPIWIYNSIDSEEVKQNNNEKISIDQLIDEEHFVLIDKVNGLRHYQLIIDQKLIDNIKVKFADSENETIKSLNEENETIEEPIKIDFYISKSDEIERIEINLLNYFGEDVEMNKMLLSLKFNDFNKTTVDVPNEVKNGIYDLQTYMATHAVDFNIDMNVGF